MKQRLVIEGKEIITETLLSEGGYGYIWKARETQTGQYLALKKMNCQSKELLKVAQNELNVLKKLPKHPNLVNFIAGEIQKTENNQAQALFLMEYCPGGTLFDLLSKNPNTRLSEKQILKILRDVLAGLKALHTQSPPITHRDVKIENILIHDLKKRVNVNYVTLDPAVQSMSILGLNKLNKREFFKYEEEFEKNTTLMYRPPEMADPYQRFEVNEKVDVWMLGCVLYSICYFVHPFQESSKLAIVTASYNIPKNNQYGEKMGDLIRIMLTPDPKNRPSIFEIEQIILNYGSINKITLNKQAQELKNIQADYDNTFQLYNNNGTQNTLQRDQQQIINASPQQSKQEIIKPTESFKSNQPTPDYLDNQFGVMQSRPFANNDDDDFDDFVDFQTAPIAEPQQNKIVNQQLSPKNIMITNNDNLLENWGTNVQQQKLQAPTYLQQINLLDYEHPSHKNGQIDLRNIVL